MIEGLIELAFEMPTHLNPPERYSPHVGVRISEGGFVIVPTTLLGGIWMQFALAYLEAKKYRECHNAECKYGGWFEVAKPKSDRPRRQRADARYCSTDCQTHAYRRRKEQARRLHNKGLSIAEIARELDVKEKSVENWTRC